MKLKTLLIVNAIVTLVMGIGSLLVPDWFISMFGATLEPAGALMMRYGGAWLIGLGLLAWSVRNIQDAEARHGMVEAFLITYVLGLIVALVGQLSAVLNALGWVPVAINLLLVLGYAYFLFVKTDEFQTTVTPRRT